MSINTFFLRVSASCNLDCDYCYVFKHRDMSWKNMPAVMPESVVISFAKRLNEYLNECSISEVNIIFHGGEPLVCGENTLIKYADLIAHTVGNSVITNFSLQTNGTLITDSFLKSCKERNIGISVSVDGDSITHNKHRKYKNGKDSHTDVLRGINLLKKYPSVFEGVIGVIDPFSDPEKILSFFDELNIENVDLLLPDSTYIDLPLGRDSDNNLYSNWLINAFDSWFYNHQSIHLRTFEHILRGLIGEENALDSFGLGRLDYLTIETNGSYHTTDILKVAYENASSIGFGVNDKTINDALNSKQVEQYNSLLSKNNLPKKCVLCKYSELCGGGSLPHRYSQENGFDNPSIYCNELFTLIEHANNVMEKAIEDAQNE